MFARSCRGACDAGRIDGTDPVPGNPATLPRLLMRMHVLVVCLCLPLLAGCWQKNVELHGVKFQEARVERDGFVIGYIGADAIVGGRPCRQGWVHLHPNGTPAGFTASQDIALARFMIPAGTWVFQDQQGIVTVCAFPRDIEIQGRLCRGGSVGSEGVQTAFYADGALKQFFAPKPVRIDGIPSGTSLFKHGIELFQNGRLRSITLTEDLILDGRIHHKGDRIDLTPEGRARDG